jgi:hypothetical protein
MPSHAAPCATGGIHEKKQTSPYSQSLALSQAAPVAPSVAHVPHV